MSTRTGSVQVKSPRRYRVLLLSQYGNGVATTTTTTSFSNRGPPAPSALTSFAEDYRTLGTRGKRLIFRLILEGFAEYCRNRPPRTHSPEFDHLTRQMEDWLTLSDEEKRLRLNQEFPRWGFRDIDKAFAMIRAFRPPGSVGIMFDIAHEWPTAPQNVKDEFVNCLTDGPTQFAHAFLDLAPQTKDLLRVLAVVALSKVPLMPPSQVPSGTEMPVTSAEDLGDGEGGEDGEEQPRAGSQEESAGAAAGGYEEPSDAAAGDATEPPVPAEEVDPDAGGFEEEAED